VNIVASEDAGERGPPQIRIGPTDRSHVGMNVSQNSSSFGCLGMDVRFDVTAAAVCRLRIRTFKETVV